MKIDNLKPRPWEYLLFTPLIALANTYEIVNSFSAENRSPGLSIFLWLACWFIQSITYFIITRVIIIAIIDDTKVNNAYDLTFNQRIAIGIGICVVNFMLSGLAGITIPGMLTHAPPELFSWATKPTFTFGLVIVEATFMVELFALLLFGGITWFVSLGKR